MIGVLKEHLQDERARFDIVLFLDAARIHCSRKVILACNYHGIRLILLPAKLTWLLQPCDTHLFVNYKRYMRQRWQEMALTMESGVVDIDTLFDIVFDTIETVVNSQSWAHAFMENGFHSSFGYLSSYIMKRLEYTAKPIMNTDPPTIETFVWCFPARTVIPENLLLKPWRPPTLPALGGPVHGQPLALPAPQLALPAPPEQASVPQARGQRLGAPRRDRVAEALAAAPAPIWTAQLMNPAPQTPAPDLPAASTGATLPWRLRSHSSPSAAKQ